MTGPLLVYLEFGESTAIFDIARPFFEAREDSLACV